MFNFQNLTDHEFENLSKDILENETNKEFRVYAPGRDGGIDIATYESSGVIGQCKHYLDSSFSTLKSSLKKELIKLETIQPNEYFLFISKKLTQRNIMDIYTIFNDYMSSPNNIYDGSRLDQLLQLDEYKDIVRTHYKLWLVSTNVLELTLNQNIFIDTDELMDEIDQESKYYVRTSHHSIASNILQNENVLIIEGNPGVGKTMLSKMLLLDHAAKGFRVKYASNNSISELKRALSINNDIKEIILLDDFLGQHYLDITSNNSSEIKSLIQFVSRRSNKKLILNSRITILNEAQSKYQQFDTFIKDRNIKKLMISLSHTSELEKATMLYNHLYFRTLPAKYFNSIKYENRYFEIIRHDNYNPRIIEFIAKEYNYSQVHHTKYYQFIMSNLDNPKDIWKEEFDSRLEQVDRILMLTLYSLTANTVRIEHLRNAFNFWVGRLTIDSTIDNFSETMKRLNRSMLRISSSSGHRRVSVTNPSVNDFIFNRVLSSEATLVNILENSLFIEQLEHIEQISKELLPLLASNYINSKIFDQSLLNMKSVLYNPYYYFIRRLKYKNILNNKFTSIIHDAYYEENTYDNLIQNWGDYSFTNELFEIFEDKQFCIYYDLYHILFDENFIQNFIKFASIENIELLNSVISDEQENFSNYYDDWHSYIEICTTSVNNQFTSLYDGLLFQEANEVVGDFVGESYSISDDEDDIYYHTRNRLTDWAYERLAELNEEIEDYIFYSEILLDIDDIVDSIDISEALEELRKEIYADNAYDEWRDLGYSSHSSSDSNTISQMFNRNWS